MNPRVLILCPQVHPKPHSGAGMRGHFQASHLSKLWPVKLATEAGVYDVVDGVFTQRIARTVPEVTGAKAYLRSLLTGKHYLYEKYNCRQWTIPDLGEFSHVIIHYPALLELLASQPKFRAQVILDTHNNEREYFESVAAQTANPIKRAVIRKQADVSERVIRQAKKAIAATISVSESDRDWVKPFCPDDARHFVVPNSLFRYNPTRWSGSGTILYVGSLNVAMNLQALQWFTTNVWPRLRRMAPELKFVVAGRNPSSTLVADFERQGIEVIPNAPSLTALYQDAICSLIPASSGSGAKIKVCEALAHGVPVVTTTHGLVGQSAAIRDCCIVRNDPDGWLEAIRTQLACDRRSSEMWDEQVKAALDSSYFGSSIKQIADFIEAG
jgi:glycosyltransferase involved in cell wall biosynthesis